MLKLGKVLLAVMPVAMIAVVLILASWAAQQQIG